MKGRKDKQTEKSQYVETSHSHEDVLEVLGAKTLEHELYERRMDSWFKCCSRFNSDAITGKKIFSQVWGLRNQIAKQNVIDDKIFATS